MASFTPYTYIQCPCHDSTNTTTTTTARLSTGDEGAAPQDSEDLGEDDEHTFDPRAPRSNFSLYPLEYLLYCDVCHQIRCPRCVSEELVTIYCPSCLFEVGSSSLKTEGNRCTRSCFQCPICISPLAVQALESAPEPSLLSADPVASPAVQGPWILTCSYCHWNSSEIGVKFDKPQGITAQLHKLRYGDDPSKHSSANTISENPPSSLSSTSLSSNNKNEPPIPETAKARFSALKSFYATHTANANPGAGGLAGLGDLGVSSPGALTRIMSIYSGNANSANPMKQKHKSNVMREANSPREGFKLANLDESAAISQLRRDGWDGTVTGEQSRAQVEELGEGNGSGRFADELWPIPYLLRTKRSKRCPVCRHIISKPESKVPNTRWRIRLVANNSIPSISIKPLSPGPGPNNTIPLLKPLQTAQFLLTFKNPLFDDVKVTLATPATTPGRFASRVTVLCPEFSIDANTDTDMYLDDVLNKAGPSSSSSSALSADQQRRRGPEENGTHQAEAGKIWERGRNWVSIVVEVVPASLRIEPPPAILRNEGDPEPDLSPLREDEDVLEIPMFVRLEWEGDVSQDQVGGGARGGGGGGGADQREKKELAYWCAIGIGRISQD
ncbi:dynactin Arp1 p62 subunit RO2 [Xylariaceae sp. FL0255]|nr:dynactin Arp1 p62 subunit RO2 [Xylariaceae sp. FL0255]